MEEAEAVTAAAPSATPTASRFDMVMVLKQMLFFGFSQRWVGGRYPIHPVNIIQLFFLFIFCFLKL
uniref:Uncharacterized protein n=1 Tax=Nelumbo nucifera TaxID=4432 RepID=A0A822Y5M1_NELNU|nr:TPA_asm: hypothetical protein HUJ06_029000 [Nelumbo nucifera]